MLSLDPSDIVTKLKFLFALVLTLFAAMHLVAGLFIARDRAFHRRLLHDLQRSAVGFRAEANGAWTWSISAAQTDGRAQAAAAAGSAAAAAADGGAAVGWFSGPFAEIARIFGGPASRLRLAIPEEIWEGSIRALAPSLEHLFCRPLRLLLVAPSPRAAAPPTEESSVCHPPSSPMQCRRWAARSTYPRPPSLQATRC